MFGAAHPYGHPLNGTDAATAVLARPRVVEFYRTYYRPDDARILVVGQAPGARVHATGVPWDDASGERLRAWMGIGKDAFYDESRVAIIPMGYCYPGRGRGGDLPPRRECADLWVNLLLARLTRIELILLIGWHAQRHFLASCRKASLTSTVQAWREYSPRYIPLPHPSPKRPSLCFPWKRA